MTEDKTDMSFLELQYDEDEHLNPDCHFQDHIMWLRAVFLRMRARNSGERFVRVCKLQEELDTLLDELFNK